MSARPLPETLPSVFVGSSSEGLQIAQYLQPELEANQFCWVTLWTQGVFGASEYSMDSLAKAARSADFAVLVASPDDAVESRGRASAAPRDNVIFELGLFMGAIGRERTFIVQQRGSDLKLPSDLDGLTRLFYNDRPDQNYKGAVAEAVLSIRERIRDQGLRPRSAPLSAGSSHGGGASSNHAEVLSHEIARVCSDARAQGWRVKTNSDTTLRLISPRGKQLTFTIGEPLATRTHLRKFVATLRGQGLRVNNSVRRPISDALNYTI